jgi:hypothetical protein
MIIIVPSRGRPERAALMVKSAKTTAREPTVRVVVAVDPDDEKLDEYRRVISDLIVLPERLGYSRSLNIVAYQEWDQHDILGAFGDDVIFQTRGWDHKVRKALATPGIAFGDDLAHHEAHPTAVWMSTSIAKALGWLALPDCHHQYVDNAWWEIGNALGLLRYLPDVVVEHMHPAYQKAELDDTYRSVYSMPQAGIDHAAFMAWRETRLAKDVARVQEALAG